MPNAVGPCVTAGLAIAGAGFWLAATTHTSPPTVTGVVQLTSVESTAGGGDPLCAITAGATPPKLGAALATPAITPGRQPGHLGNGFYATDPGEKGGDGGAGGAGGTGLVGGHHGKAGANG